MNGWMESLDEKPEGTQEVSLGPRIKDLDLHFGLLSHVGEALAARLRCYSKIWKRLCARRDFWSILLYPQYRSQIDYILCSRKWRGSIQSAKTRLGADCGSDHKFSIAKFRLKLKTVEKTTILVWPKSNPLWLYSGSDKEIQGIRSDRVPEELWVEVHSTVWEAVIKNILKKKKCKKEKWLFEEALQIAEKRKGKGKGEKERYTHLNEEFQRIARRDKKALSEQCK